MDSISTFMNRIIIFQIIIDLFNVSIGVGLCFGALKWRKGLISSVAAYWGLFLGAILGLTISTSDLTYTIIFAVFGLVVFPILAYNVAGVNRFVVGFIVATKLAFMVTTVFMKQGRLDIGYAFLLPLIAGAFVGLILMAWTEFRVSAFVGACAFLGASQVAPTLVQYIHQIQFGLTGDFSYMYDAYDLIFALFKIELTDGLTLLFMGILMPLGIYRQLRSLKAQGIAYSTPVIVYETKRKGLQGKVNRLR